jgi:Wadjet anti plasmid transformation system JetA-like protein
VSQEPLPNLFSRVSPALFSPLSGALAPIYWEILATFYRLEFEREPFFIPKPTAVDVVEHVLDGSDLWQARREELLPEVGGVEQSPPAGEAPLRTSARRLLANLEAAGWIHFEYRSAHGEVLNFHPHSARILETLLRVARDQQPVFQGYAHMIATLLRPEGFSGKPGVALMEAKRHTLEMVRELKILDRNIYAFTRRMVEEAVTAAGVLEEGLEKYRAAVLANYHRLKTVDNLYKWRGEILHRLDAIERDDLALEAARRWYADQLGLDLAGAAESVRGDLSVMRQQFETLPEITDDIDDRNARFSGMALRKLMYLLRQERRTEGDLQRIIDALSAESGPEIDLDVFRCELLGDDFLYTAPRTRPRLRPEPLRRAPSVDAAAIRSEAAASLRRPFSRARINALVAELLRGKPYATLEDAPLESDVDYVRLIYIAAYGLDGDSPFRFRPSAAGGRPVRKGPYGFPRGRLERARGKD